MSDELPDPTRMRELREQELREQVDEQARKLREQQDQRREDEERRQWEEKRK